MSRLGVMAVVDCCGGSTSPGPNDQLAATYNHSTERGTSAPSNVEQVVWQDSVDFDELAAAIVTLECRLTAQTKQTGAGLGTYRVRVGGTSLVPDGIVWAILSPPNRTIYPNTPDTVLGAALARPLGSQLVKITSVDATLGEDARVQAVQVIFS